MTRLRHEWKEAAEQFARSCWHIAEWRCFDVRYASRTEIANAAMCQYRRELSFAYSQAIDHPRSKRAIESVFKSAQALARVGKFMLTAEEAL